ncbi:MAG: phosphoglycerate kinase [Planctomycetes bacterium]|nr:phosphoglycerate kinase [Planctomycetota bacterium]
MKTIKDLENALEGKRLLMRVDFNLPLDKETGEITNDLRIRQALPTVRYALERNARTICMSHLGRPKGEKDPALSLEPVAERFSELLGAPVKFAPDCVGNEVEEMVNELEDGEVLLLENLRFHAGEKANDEDFAQSLASLGDYFVNDAFGTAHRAHASTVGVAQNLPAVAGFLIEKEVDVLSTVLKNPEKPFVAVMGGAKVSDKIEAIRNLLKLADRLLVGGAMAYTFLKSQGRDIGNSMVEDEKLDLAGELLAESGDKIRLPIDHVCAEEINEDVEPQTVGVVDIPDGLIGLDIGPQTAELYAQEVRQARTVTWNGPLGYFEIDAFSEGTRSLARAMAECDGMTVVGGGETGESVEELGLQDEVSHVSTGGGACLEFLSGNELPALAVLK